MAQLVSKISGLFISKRTGDVDTPQQYLKLTKKCMARAQKMTLPSLSSSQRVNFEQCKYLADKLKLAVVSAHSFLVLLNRGFIYFPSQKDKENCLNIFKLLYTLAKEVENFIQSCWKDAWIQAAVTLTDVSEHISSIGFNLELWTLCFFESKKLQNKRRTCLTLTEVDDIFKAEVEIVTKKASLDRDMLLRNLNIALQVRKPTSIDFQLAVLLLERLGRPRLIPNDIPGSSHLSLSETVSGSLKQMEMLGKGSFAMVHKAMWLGVEVAKKTFYGPYFPFFEKEVSILGGLSHPYITSLLCYAKDKLECSIVMEVMDKDLFSLIQERRRRPGHRTHDFPFGILEAVDIMLQVGEGMRYLHGMKIVHRDLKSFNILVKCVKATDLKIEYVQVKVADFGLSKIKEMSTTYSNQTPNMGTTRWMAPELIKSSNAESHVSNGETTANYPFKSDVYSFGMVCYEILTGDLPFPSTLRSEDIKTMVLNGDRPELPEGYPLLFKGLIDRCLSFDASKRPCFDDICAELRHLKCLLLMPSELDNATTSVHNPGEEIHISIQPSANYERAEEMAAVMLNATEGSAPAPVKWLVALDIGTTYSGFAYTDVRCPQSIYLCTEWPRKGSERHYCKTLTALYYKLVGPGTFQCTSWGHPAQSDFHMDKFNTRNASQGFYLPNFKLLSMTDLNDPSLVAQLPHPLTVNTILTDYLKHIGELVLTQIKNSSSYFPHSLRRFNRDSVQWCVTVPSIWDENAKQRIKECMMNARLVSVEGGMEAVKVVLKPEAASFHCQQLLRRLHYDRDVSFDVGDKIMVVDIGGRTVDIVVQEVVESGNANFKVQELAVCSDECGGSVVDQLFMRLLSERTRGYLDEFLQTGVSSSRLRLLKDWEYIKCDFGQKMMSCTDSYEITLHNELGAKWKAYEKEHGYNRQKSYSKVELTQKDLESIFDPVVDKILGSIAAQLVRVEGIKVMFVVGGFAGSAYLMQRIRAPRFSREVDHIFSPPNPGSAIMHGAIALAQIPDAHVA